MSCLNRISKPLTFLAVHKACCGKKVFGKKEGGGGGKKRPFKRILCGGEVYISIPIMKALHEVFYDARRLKLLDDGTLIVQNVHQASSYVCKECYAVPSGECLMTFKSITFAYIFRVRLSTNFLKSLTPNMKAFPPTPLRNVCRSIQVEKA